MRLNEEGHAVAPDAQGRIGGGRSAAGPRGAILALHAQAGNRAVQALLRQDMPRPQRLTVQRAVKTHAAVSALSDLLKEHRLDAWYAENWKSGRVREIAEEIAKREQTTLDNLKSQLRAHPTITPLIRGHRMQPETALEQPPTLATAALQDVYDAYLRLLFYHATKAGPDVRAEGLNPARGGKGGYAEGRSLASKRAENVAAAKGKIYVTRKYSEAKQYQKGEGEILRVLIPVAQQGSLKVDPDSQFGLYTDELLKSIDRPNRQLDWWGYSYLMQEVKTEEARNALPSLYAELLKAKAFEPGVEEAERRLPAAVLTEMSQAEIEVALEKASSAT